MDSNRHILTLGDTDDDVGLLSNNHMPREFVESWKVGPGRKKAWRTAPRLRFANKDWIRLLRYSQQSKAIFRSCPMPLRDSELIKQAPISSSAPTVMLEHGMVGQYCSQTYPKPNAVKKIARRLGIPTSKTSRPRTLSKPFPPKADRLVDDHGGDGGDDVDDEEDDDDSFEPRPWYLLCEGDLFSDIGDAM